MEQDIAGVAAGTLNSLWNRNQIMLMTEAVMLLEASMVPQHRAKINDFTLN